MTMSFSTANQEVLLPKQVLHGGGLHTLHLDSQLCEFKVGEQISLGSKKI